MSSQDIADSLVTIHFMFAEQMNTEQLLKPRHLKKRKHPSKSVITTMRSTRTSMIGSIVTSISSEELQLSNRLRLLMTFSTNFMLTDSLMKKSLNNNTVHNVTCSWLTDSSTVNAIYATSLMPRVINVMDVENF